MTISLDVKIPRVYMKFSPENLKPGDVVLSSQNILYLVFRSHGRDAPVNRFLALTEEPYATSVDVKGTLVNIKLDIDAYPATCLEDDK